MSAERSEFVQRVRAELEKEARRAALLTGAVRGSTSLLFDQPVTAMAIAQAERIRAELDILAARAGLSPRQAEALQLHRQFGPEHHEQVAREMGIGRSGRSHRGCNPASADSPHDQQCHRGGGLRQRLQDRCPQTTVRCVNWINFAVGFTRLLD